MQARRWISLFPVGTLVLAALFARPSLAVDSAVIDAQQQRIAVVESVSPTVVAVFGAAGGGGGSGVLITADGYAVTNFHVSSGAGDFMKCGLNDGVLYDAVIVGIDPTGDVALIKLLGRDDFPTATIGDSDKLNVGDWVYAMGNPFLLATDFHPTVTYGIVSGVHRYQYPEGTFLEYTDCIQTDSSINPGNSGGPLFNSNGELVGINGRGSFEKRGRVNSGAGYAISINQIKHFMGHLRGGRIVDHATLGASVSGQADGTVTVSQIIETSQAYRRGLREGDEIVSFAGRPIRSVNQFKNILGIYPDEWKIPLVFRHEEQSIEALVRLRALHRESELLSDDGPFPRQQKPERPRPDDKQPGDEDPQKDPEQPDKKAPRPQLPSAFAPAPPPPPEKYKHMLVKRDGYSNYYFNQLEQDRLVARIKSLGDFSSATGTWSIVGSSTANVPFEMTLGDAAVTMEFGKEVSIQQFNDELKDEPARTGGLLVAMHHLRLMLSRGPEAFNEVYYLGHEPLDGAKPVDVLIAKLSTAESRWYFDVETGAIAGFDLRLSNDADECELRLLEWQDRDGRKLPSLVSVRNGDHEFGTLKLEKYEFKAGSAAAKNTKAATGDGK